MKHILITMPIVFISLILNAQEKTFQGKINGIDSAEINVSVLPLKEGETPIFENIQCVQGKFECTVNFNLDMWHLVRLNSKDFNTVFGREKSSTHKLKNRGIFFFIRPKDHISIIANIGEYGINYQVLGNDISTQRNIVTKKLFPLEEKYNGLTIQKEKVAKENEKSKKLEKQIRVINEQIDSISLNSIIKHPDWIYSAEMLAGFPEDTISKYFKSFTTDVQNSFFGIHLSKIMNAAQTGSSAPEFTLQNEKGKNISLKDFLGKYIVLDFWGTWCGSCVKGIPKMKEYYSKYRDKVEFLSIACRDSKQAWLKAIDKYDLNWTNLFTENKEITDKYGVEGYPTKIIIDKEGKIVLKTIGESDEFYEKMDEIFNNNR